MIIHLDHMTVEIISTDLHEFCRSTVKNVVAENGRKDNQGSSSNQVGFRDGFEGREGWGVSHPL